MSAEPSLAAARDAPTDATGGRDDPAGERREVSVADAEVRERNLTRLRRIEGQVRGLQKMVAGDRYCADVMMQIASVHEALRSVGRELMRHHLARCTSVAVRGGAAPADAMYDELLDLMYRNAR